MYKHYNTKHKQCQEITNPIWKGYEEQVSSPLVKKVTYYKWLNQKLIKVLILIGEAEKAKTIFECGTFLQLGLRNGHEVIQKSNFCRQRLCNVCSWRKSRKFVGQMFPVMDLLQGQGYGFIFVTLTIKNPEAEALKDTSSLMLKAWDKLCKRRKHKRAWQGFCRSLEITYNPREDTYHPHIHALIVVNNDYFRSNDYITTEELSQAWGECLDVDYNPHCKLQKVKPKNNDVSIAKGAVVETLKYAYKIMQCDINIKTVSAFLAALNNKRLLSFGGVVAEARRALQQGDLEADTNLNDEANAEENIYDVLYLFSPSGWKIYERGNNEA